MSPDTLPPISAPQSAPPELLEGIVVAIAHGFFEVAVPSESSTLRSYLCTLRGRLRRARPLSPPRPVPATTARFSRGATQRGREQPQAEERDTPAVRIAPGDRVVMRPLGGAEGVIEQVAPRRTVLSRARSESGEQHIMLANLDSAILVFAVREPEPHFGMLDRYLALCEHAGVEVTICLNKLDLEIPAEVETAAALYRGLGYRVLLTSAATGAGVETLRERLAGRTSLLTGPSGVGKSSLLNELLPEAGQRTREVSEATGKGRHTTTGVRLLPLPGGGWLADSAGIRELALWNVPSEELPGAFVELRPLVGQCEYEDCEHTEGEEGCAMWAALAEGRITPERFASFERLLAEAHEAEAPKW
jgi:ribosome biogenesis GTPase / thiamine phosphate phosphatase